MNTLIAVLRAISGKRAIEPVESRFLRVLLLSCRPFDIQTYT